VLPDRHSFENVRIVWRFETRRLWTWQRGLLLFGGGLLAAVLVGGIGTAGQWAVSRAAGTPSGPSVVIMMVWAWSADLLGLHPPAFMTWRTRAVPSVPPDHWILSTAAVVHFASSYALHPLRHYFLPAVAGLSIAKEEEQRRLDALRMTAISEGELLTGKWLGVLTPFAII